MTPNEIVHKAMGGLRWHDYKDGYCCCSEIMNVDQMTNHTNPDYSHRSSIGEVYAWMRTTGKWIPFQDFLRVRLFRAGAKTIQALAEFHNRDEIQQIELIAEWITEGQNQ